MIDFIKKNKATIISVLTAVLSLAIGLSKLDLGVKVGAIIAILVVVIPVFINLLTEGFNDRTVDLIVNAVSIIQQILINTGAVVALGDVDVESETTTDIGEVAPEEEDYSPIILTKDEIREMLLQK